MKESNIKGIQSSLVSITVDHTHSNHVISGKQVDTLICYTTMHRNAINFLYNPGHVTL